MTVCSFAGTPENRPGCWSCEEACKKVVNDHVKTCTALRVSCKFLAFIINNF